MLKLAIIGIGNMGSAHARSILEGKCPKIELTAVCDTNPDRLAGFPDIKGFTSAKELCEADICDAVLIAVPHYDHPPLARLAFEHGLHAMCEKPAGVYTTQVRQMNAAADRAGKVFGMMFNQRTDHIYRKMKQFVSDGTLGEIRRVNWIITDWYRSQCYYDSGAWRATWFGEGGGVLLNQCPHQLDLLQWICGLPSKVHAHMHFGKWHNIEVEDDVTAYLQWKNGATGVFITSTGDAPGTNRFEITLDGGKLVAEDGQLKLWKNKTHINEFSAENKEPFGSPEVEYINVETDGQSPQHVGVLNAFARAILDGTPLIADGREGLNGLMLSNAMHLSAFAECEVEIPFDEELYFEYLMQKVKTSKRKEKISEIIAKTEGSY